MNEKKIKRTGILPSDIDSAGNVMLWDHGPIGEPRTRHHNPEVDNELRERAASEKQAWHETHGEGPIGLPMHSSDAAHALMTDPDRYALEPDDLDEGEVEKLMAEMREKRERAARAPQDAIDRRVAIAAIISDRASAKAVEEPEDEEHTGATAKTNAEYLREAEADRVRVAREKAGTTRDHH